MSVETRVEEWLRKMGYDGEIPSSLPKICNPSTTFIWEQLISNVKPRQEVELVRKNIIINRLTTKSLEQQDQFSYPIKEIQTYVELKEKQKKIDYLETSNEEKSQMIDDFLKKNKMLYLAINHKKAKIKEKLERKYLLEKKSNLVREEIQRAQEDLTLARNLTPVEMDENANGDEVAQTLQKCAEKLRKLFESNAPPKTNTSRSSNTSSIAKILKTPKISSKNNNFSKYLSQSSTFNEIILTNKKISSANKENVQNNAAVKCLFTFGENLDVDKTNKKPKRESLGLLPNECLNTSEEIDNFLLSPNKNEHFFLQSITESIMESSTRRNDDLIEKLSSDENVKEMLKNLLYTNNRFLILSQWKKIYKKAVDELRTSTLIEYNKLLNSDREISKEDLSELYFMHVKNELEKEKNRIVLKKLQDTVKRRKEEAVLQLWSKSRNKEEARQLFELKIEEAYLNGANNFLRKEINAQKNAENTSTNELQIITVKMKQVHEEIGCKMDSIENLIGNIERVLKFIKNNREETSLCVRKLSPLLQDLSWAGPLTQEFNSKEIETFKMFPLEYNRKLKWNESKVPYYSISETAVQPYVELDSDTAETLTTILDTPFSFAEDVIFNALRMKIHTNKLQEIHSKSEIPLKDFHKYSAQELAKKEEYLEPLMNKLSCVINSTSVKEVLDSPNYMKEVMDLWLEMPFRNYISDKRLVDGHNYKFYENKLEELHNNLSLN